MIGNPEFTRNIWLQCTWPRLLGAAVVIGILYYAATYWGQAGEAGAAIGGKWLFHFIIGLWSTRRAADALAEEVGSNTWETQRMSGLSAWSMAWGKLLGATAYPWFCALLCLVLMDVSLAAERTERIEVVFLNANLILSGLIAQAVSLSVALLLLRKAQLRRRLMVTFAQVCGLIVYANSFFGDVASLMGGPHHVSWYGTIYPAVSFDLISLAIFGFWMWFGLYRLMRLELQYRNWPWAWLGFLAYALIFFGGFFADAGVPTAERLAAPFILAIILTYLSFLAEPKDPVRYRWGIIALLSGDLGKALSFIPLWLITYAVMAGLGVILAITLPTGSLSALENSWLTHLWFWPRMGFRPQVFFLACILFVARDILFLLLLNFGAWRQRADLAGLVYLLIAYFPLASIIGFVGGLSLLPIVMPYDTGNLVLSFAPVIAEVIALAILVSQRWRAAVAIRGTALATSAG